VWMDVRLETLTYKDEVFHVAVGELTNVNLLNKEEIVSLSSEQIEGIMAVQLLDSALVAGAMHLLSAAQNALNAWKGKYAISRNLAVEILLYASGQHQIGVALDKLGVNDETTSIAAVILATDESKLKSHIDYLIDEIGPVVPQPFAPTEERMQLIMMHFGINDAEITAVSSSESLEARYQALSGCVISRVSMVALEA
jgi:tRNA threonylcarbamoyladenosine modification (KEOPS) complex Cgi121 subunit